MLFYSTTNREGYREYKSNPEECINCPYLSQCTLCRKHRKVVTRHVWEDYMEICEDIRHTLGNKEIYELRKETVERVFGTEKGQHGLRYTNLIGKARMEIMLLIEETFNIIMQENKDKKIIGEVSVRIEDEGIVLNIKDTGRVFDVTDTKDGSKASENIIYRKMLELHLPREYMIAAGCNRVSYTIKSMQKQ